MRHRRFTSESVSMGHPDKVADRISDSVLDYALSFDPHARVACETFITGGLLIIGGEIRAHDLPSDLDEQIEQRARDTIRRIGYSGPGTGFDPDGAVASSEPDPEADRWANNVVTRLAWPEIHRLGYLSATFSDLA